MGVAAELEAPRLVKTPVAPSADEREEHEVTGHAVYRDWCAHYLGARGIGQRHVVNSRENSDEIALTACDYGYIGGEDECLPILVTRDHKYQTVHTTFVDAKGPTDYAVRHLANIYKLVRAQTILGWTDGEHAVKRLKERAAKDAEIEMTQREPTPGDRQANGFIENAVREVKRQIRVIRSDLEAKLGFVLHERDPVFRWLPKHTSDCITRCRKCVDGRTPERRRTGRLA